MPRLPRRVRGAITDYRVTCKLEDDSNAGEHNASSADGAEIRVSPTLNEDTQWHVWWHEMVHKWELEGGFKLKDEDNDSDVDRLATAIHADWRRNNWKLPGEK